MPRSRKKSPALAVSVPQNDGEARTAIRQMGDAQRHLTRIETELNDKIAALQEEYGAQSEPVIAQIAALQQGIQTYCEANRARLTNNSKRKSHQFSTGWVQWRHRPPKVTVRGLDDVLQALKDRNLINLITVRESVNKDAMLADPETAQTVPGITIGSSGEDFVIEPFAGTMEQDT